ncbi:early nodulin-like protein 3-like [Hibiscus syriacus]|uniref:Early nodulin-like protein 3-like n=1 Tax=Hibiscus syriacus TaxID=106335 RepID=A0A6A2XP68_HIBSY|nr:early nodulin-like protein 3-like [Hibiscus syriacus]
MWGAPAEPADSYYEVRPECTDVPGTKFKIRPGKTLSVRKWKAAFSPDGQLDIGQTLGRIHRGGIHPTIRGEVWEFLLGCFDPRSTYEEREQLREERREQYEKWKIVCHEIFPVVGSGEFITAPVITEDAEAATPNSTEIVNDLISNGPLDKRIINWLLLLHQIGLDVKRTDRSLIFYEKQENLAKLWDILVVYAWIDTDVGYCQGMSDICSPMIILLKNEADAFWCFERLMRRLRGNFKCTESSVGVESQLSHLAMVTQVIDPKLHQHLETLGGGDYLFAVRMLMVLFRREFSFCDSLYLWGVWIELEQMMWALEYDPDLFYLYEEPTLSMEEAKMRSRSMRHYGKFERENMKIKSEEAPLPISVFLVASVLKDKSTKLLHEARGLDDVVKILNDITGSLDAKKACNEAIKLHKISEKSKRLRRRSPRGKFDGDVCFPVKKGEAEAEESWVS